MALIIFIIFDNGKSALDYDQDTNASDNVASKIEDSETVRSNNSDKNSSNTSITVNNSSGPVGVSNPSTSEGFSLKTVAKHNSASSCWSAMDGNVYDLTPFINKHPGGSDAILLICGVDGSEAFNDQHGGQPRPADELKNFWIGPII